MKRLDDRYCYLCNTTNPVDAALTDLERAEGWHWCPEGDGRPVGPGCIELRKCDCVIYPTLELFIP